MEADQGVLLKRGLKTVPKTIAQLAKLKLCSQAGTTAATLIADRVQPVTPARFYGNTTLLLNALQAGRRCDAVVYDAADPGDAARAGARFATARSRAPSTRARTTASCCPRTAPCCP